MCETLREKKWTTNSDISYPEPTISIMWYSHILYTDLISNASGRRRSNERTER